MATPPKTRRKAELPVAAAVATEAAVKPARKAAAKKRSTTQAELPLAPTEPLVEQAPAKKPRSAKRATVKAEPAAARPAVAAPARKAAAKKSARKDVAPADEALGAVEPAAKPVKKSSRRKPAAAAVAPEPYRWTRLESAGDVAPFGSYELADVASGVSYVLRLRGSRAGYYSCNCASFAASAQGSCEHSGYLLGQLQAQGGELAASLRAGAEHSYSEVWLSQALQRRLHWHAGTSAPAALVQASLALVEADGSFSADAVQVLSQLMRLASEAGHELRVTAGVWEQLAWAGDARQRALRLEQVFNGTQAGVDLPLLTREPVPAYQWEAAAFAVCAGRALLADDLGLSQRAQALLALRLWQQVFGLTQTVIVAPESRHALWQAEAQRLLGGWPEGVQLLDLALAGEAGACELLIVEAVQDLGLPLPALPAAPHLLLLADRELLGDSLLPAMVAWLDCALRGPLARLLALGERASKRQQREALESLMLSRRRCDMQAQLPLSIESSQWLELPDAAPVLDQAALQQARHLLQRWQRLAYLGHGEQLQLMQSLAALRQAAVSERACAVKAEAVIELLPRILPAAASRLLVLAQQDATLQPLADRLHALGLSVQSLRAGQPLVERRAALAIWQGGQGQVLLASDAACRGLELAQPGTALIHADLPWNPAQRQRRAAALAGATRGLPCWQLLLRGSLDAGLLLAHAGQSELPSAALDFESAAAPFLDAAALAPFMSAVERALGAVPG